MIELGPEYSVQWDGRPPGMSRIDSAIWRAWKDQNVSNFSSVYYNVRIGKGTHGTQDQPHKLQWHWWRLCCRRIDVVIQDDDISHIIEVRHSAMESAIARLMVYEDLWVKEDPTMPFPQLVLLTNIKIPQTEELAKREGIEYIVV